MSDSQDSYFRPSVGLPFLIRETYSLVSNPWSIVVQKILYRGLAISLASSFRIPVDALSGPADLLGLSIANLFDMSFSHLVWLWWHICSVFLCEYRQEEIV